MFRKFIEFNGELFNIDNIESIYDETASKYHKEDKPNVFAIIVDLGNVFASEEFLTLEERQARKKELKDLLCIQRQ